MDFKDRMNLLSMNQYLYKAPYEALENRCIQATTMNYDYVSDIEFYTINIKTDSYNFY